LTPKFFIKGDFFMTHLYLVRHGQTDWNAQGRWQGQADIPLNALGLSQADQQAAALAPLELAAIYSSDLSRARHTAAPLARLTGLPVQLDPRLREIHQGGWQGLLIAETRARFPDVFQNMVNNPEIALVVGGESASQVQERMITAINDIVNLYPRQRVAVVSHGFALAAAYAHFHGDGWTQIWDLIPANSAWLELELAQA
jgi:broad specificity phosphatase PhoE